MKINQSIDGIVPVVCTWSLRMHLSPANMFIFITDVAIFWPCYSFTCQLNEQNNGETTSWVQQELWVITFYMIHLLYHIHVIIYFSLCFHLSSFEHPCRVFQHLLILFMLNFMHVLHFAKLELTIDLYAVLLRSYSPREFTIRKSNS